jgi:hypothetical protein
MLGITIKYADIADIDGSGARRTGMGDLAF